jgi:signal peptidase I
VTNDRDTGSEPTWERRLRALDDELASYGANVGEAGSTVPGPDVVEPPPAAEADGAETDAADGAVAVAAGSSADATPVTDGVASPAGADAHDAPDAEAEATEEETADQAAARRRKALIDWVVVIGVALLVAFLVRTFVLAHFVVDGVSMTSTLHDDDRVFVNKLSYRLHDPNRGDVVVLHQLNGASERDLIKRVIGLPGEEVRVEECVVYIDDVALQEPYLDPAATTPGTCGRNVEPILVPDDHVFVMGDNRGGSMDSRDLGPIDDDDLVGRAFVVFWPQSHWQWL